MKNVIFKIDYTTLKVAIEMRLKGILHNGIFYCYNYKWFK